MRCLKTRHLPPESRRDSTMERYEIPLLDESGRTIGYGERWWAHRVRDGPDGPILGQKHAGITIACLDDSGRILIQRRRHRIFDKVWSLSGDTHPRKYGSRRVESLSAAARRCAKEDLGVVIKNWTQRLSIPYSAQRSSRLKVLRERDIVHSSREA